MQTGFTFNGRHSSELGLSVSSERRVMPELRSYFYDNPLSDGGADFCSVNSDERPHYSDRIWKLDLSVREKNPRALSSKLSRIASWLRGYGELIFDDMCVLWRGYFLGDAAAAPTIYGTTAKMSVYFRSSPFSYLLYGSDDTVYDTAVLPELLRMSEAQSSGWFDISLTAGENTADIDYPGTAWTRPVIEISSNEAVTSLIIEYNGRSLEISDISETDISVDCAAASVTAGGESIMTHVSGDFFELIPGSESMSIDISADADMRLVFTPRFFYDAELE